MMTMVSRHPVIFLVCVLIGSGCAQLRLDMRRPVPVQAGGMELIAVSGNAYQRGLQIGQAYAEDLRRIIPTALMIEDQLEAEEMATGEPSREDALLLAAAQWPAEQRQEMAGIADGSGLKEADVLRYNTLAAIRQAWQTRKAPNLPVKSATRQAIAKHWSSLPQPNTLFQSDPEIFSITPMPALQAVWHPILLYRTNAFPATNPASAPGVLDRHIEARQVGMVWPLWLMNRHGVFTFGTTTDEAIKDCGTSNLWPVQWLAVEAPEASSAEALTNLMQSYVHRILKHYGVLSFPELMPANLFISDKKSSSEGQGMAGEKTEILPPLIETPPCSVIVSVCKWRQDQLMVQLLDKGPISIINLSTTKPLIENGSESSSASKHP